MSQKEKWIFCRVTSKCISEMKICITVRNSIEFLAYEENCFTTMLFKLGINANSRSSVTEEGYIQIISFEL